MYSYFADYVHKLSLLQRHRKNNKKQDRVSAKMEADREGAGINVHKTCKRPLLWHIIQLDPLLFATTTTQIENNKVQI